MEAVSDPLNNGQRPRDQESNDEEEASRNTQCGIGSWRPDYLQRFVNPTSFLIVFSVIAIVHGAASTLFIGSTTTLEKRYAYNAKMSGFIQVADNISALILSPVMGFMGRYYSRTKMMGAGMVFMAISCWMTALPYLIYGPVKDWSGGATHSGTNGTKDGSSSYEFCDAFSDQCDEDSSVTVWPAVYILWIGSFINGVGYTSFYAVGWPYLDDNVSKQDAPIVHAVLGAVRLLGPSMGYVLTSTVLSWYEDPIYTPNFGPSDPRWIGAWWLGYLVIGSLIFVSALPLFLFPVDLQPERKRMTSLAPQKPVSTKQDVKDTIKRLVTNPLFVFDRIASVSRAVGLRGYLVNQPKYLESQFRKTAAEASLLSGTTSLLAMSVGMIGGGLLVRWVKPGPRALCTFILVAEFFASFGLIAGMFLGCPSSEFSGIDQATKNVNFDATCNSRCECSKSALQPVCSADGITNYFSPCFAGCLRNSTYQEHNVTYFGGCGCEMELGHDEPATSGYCPVDCGDNFFYYIAFITAGKLIAATSISANIIVGFRSIDEKDKTVAQGLTAFIYHVFTVFPFVMIFGGITDAACLIWGEKCGDTGNCWLYDNDKFRIYLHAAASLFMTVGSLFDIAVIYYANRMTDIYGDEEKEKAENEDGVEMMEGGISLTSQALDSKHD
ncbi:Solute carrier organic anion transporter family member 3A1 [Halotydeus destructor]|nr:Solute carrier organic anion transporter family member 3A1 [Halotydeus destructor]